MNDVTENKRFKETSKINHQRQKAKVLLMEKYNLSSDDAERILLKLENKQRENAISAKHSKTASNNLNSVTSNKNQNSVKRGSDSVRSVIGQNQVNSVKRESKLVSQNQVNSNSMQQDSASKSSNVDLIMSDLIPDYNKQLSIEAKNLDLTFEVDNERTDTLKEGFINLLKHKKSDKIKIHALNDISFKIYKGEKVGIIGYNGAGKSTLLNVITGSYVPDSGSVKTYGKISPLLGLGAGFDYNYSGRKNIFLNGAVLGYDKKFLESKFDEIIEFSELGEFIDIPIKNYSSGMIAKLAFSIATIVEPDILIIDEILGVGDVNFKKKSSDKIKSLMDGGATVLLVSHSIPQIRELCDKAIWIDHGKLREMGEVNKVCDHYLVDAEKASNEQLANIQFK